MLDNSRLTPLVVLHANHANELDEHVADAVAKLADARAILFNQAVLLRGVNDSTEAQAALCERLIDLRVTPYYLHQLDRVAGAAHFEVPISTGRRIVEELRARLPGYAVPRYVQEEAGVAYKVFLT
jgi:L-lysine 2,3-aminomutase